MLQGMILAAHVASFVILLIILILALQK